mmetsp:Transcript_36108/g.71548  ORF Transcript_36108/g.71548 Transcript_36108/m.71548 type:complete len:80 (-) Transcript_36108:47-286(-)
MESSLHSFQACTTRIAVLQVHSLVKTKSVLPPLPKKHCRHVKLSVLAQFVVAISFSSEATTKALLLRRKISHIVVSHSV